MKSTKADDLVWLCNLFFFYIIIPTPLTHTHIPLSHQLIITNLQSSSSQNKTPPCLMKVHPFTRGFFDYEPSLSLACSSKRLRPIAPKLATADSFDLKTFIRPDTANKSPKTSDHQHLETSTHPGGTRWNPTEEQIGILEMLYRGGMRTPNAPQIEQITVQLGKYGKIEGKNVFYWFQNHKARERQKQKRSSTGLTLSSSPPPSMTPAASDVRSTYEQEGEDDRDSPYKRRCRSWINDDEVGGGEKMTLELFPLHPEERRIRY